MTLVEDGRGGQSGSGIGETGEQPRGAGERTYILCCVGLRGRGSSKKSTKPGM